MTVGIRPRGSLSTAPDFTIFDIRRNRRGMIFTFALSMITVTRVMATVDVTVYDCAPDTDS